MSYRTNYFIATHWLNGNLIMCNNIGEIDPSIWDNCRFSLWEEDEDGNERETEIFQYFLTSYSESEVEFLEEHFGLLFTYSELLDLYILCVDHWGTSWDYVTVDTDLENAKANLGDRK